MNYHHSLPANSETTQVMSFDSFPNVNRKIVAAIHFKKSVKTDKTNYFFRSYSDGKNMCLRRHFPYSFIDLDNHVLLHKIVFKQCSH